MKKITDNFQCPIFKDHKPGFCLRQDCPIYWNIDNKEYCIYDEYRKRKAINKNREPCSIQK